MVDINHANEKIYYTLIIMNYISQINPWHILAITILILVIIGPKFIILVGLISAYFWTGQKNLVILAFMYLIFFYWKFK